MLLVKNDLRSNYNHIKMRYINKIGIMIDLKSNNQTLRGGGFLFEPPRTEAIFLPEVATEEQKMIFHTARAFVDQEVLPNMKRIEQKEPGLAPDLFLKLGEVGLLGAHMPENYGGLDLDANTIALMLSGIAKMGSFNTPYAAHTGIGMLPILYFGTDRQKEKYLPPMISGELIGSYCLTEPTSGSDALAARTTADYDQTTDTYVINGQKMWITNAGYAGIFIVFAQIDGSKFTAFLIDRDTPGLTLGEEEEKLGIHGSSTRQVFLEDVRVPADNILGEIGKGHQIAFNVLNMGRFKLGILTMAGCKISLKYSVDYARQRRQFGQPIASFGAVKVKLAEQAVRAVTVESATYRLSELMSLKVKELREQGVEPGQAKLTAAREYAIECSILKIAGSEALDYCVDETVQIHGGMGYSEELPPARMYRDARINRIYEGTNEINRLLMIDQVMKRGMKGELPLLQAFQQDEKEKGPFDMADQIRTIILKLIGYVGRRQMAGQFDLEKEQQVVMSLADICTELFLVESLWMRIEKRKSASIHVNEALWGDLLELQMHKAHDTVRKASDEVLSYLFEGKELRDRKVKFSSILPNPESSVIRLRQRIAEEVTLSEGDIL